MKSSRSQRRELERKFASNKKYSKKEFNDLVYKLRYELNDEQADKIISKIPSNKINLLESEPLPNSIGKIRSSDLPPSTINIGTEIKWCLNIILKYSNKINLYINLERKFSINFLKGDYTNAARILDEIESKVCYSIWGIEKRLLLTEYQNGFSKQKEVLANIKNENTEPVVRILSLFQSLRVEKKLPIYKFESLVENHLNLYDGLSAKQYLRFKMTPFNGFSLKSPEYIIYYESVSSVIDRYNSLIGIILYTISNEEITIQKESILNAVNSLIPEITDPRLSNSYNFIAKESQQLDIKHYDKEIINILDDYTSGNYEEALKKVKKVIINSPDIFELYEIYVKSILYSNSTFHNIFEEDSIAGKTLESLWHLMCKDDETFDALFDIQKFMYAVGWSSWSCRMSSYVHNEYQIKNLTFNDNLFSTLNSSFFNPDLSTYIQDKKTSLRILAEIEKNKGTQSSTVELLKRMHHENDETLDLPSTIDPYRLALYDAKALQKSGNYKLAYKKYCQINENIVFTTNNNYITNYESITHGKFICLLGLNNIIDAVSLATRVLLKNEKLFFKFEDENLLHTLKESLDEDLHRLIEGAIYLHIYQASVNDLYIAYDNFMIANQINYPHSIKEISQKFERNALIYFLKNICKQEIYASSYHFSNQTELDNERIEICLYLAEIDVENIESYIQEISEITRSILIRKGIQQIDESKIYVDNKGIRKILDKDLKESFYRYLELNTLTYEQLQKFSIDEQIVVPYLNQNHNKNTSKEVTEKDIKITSYSRFKSFQDMFLKIRDKFIASNEYGLDTYLSTRIRHGTLLGHIRSIFEKHHLITTKDSVTGKYLPNEFWQENLQIVEPFVQKEFYSIMSQFSEQIDSISEELKNRYLQISTEKKVTEGMFDYSYYEYDILHLFQNEYGKITDYELFLTSVIDELWKRTEDNLIKIRRFILEDEKEKFLSKLDTLHNLIINLYNEHYDREPKNIIQSILKCQTDISIEIERIARWFQRTNSKSINEFDIQLPIEASLQVLKKIYPSFQNLNVSIDDSSKILFEGEYFPQFTDIIQILLENMIKHSKLTVSDLIITININEIDNRIRISADNNISKLLDLDEVNRRISNTRKIIDNNDIYSDDSIRGEHKSGYPKLKKILFKDLACEKVDIVLSNVEDTDSPNDQRIFLVEISFDTISLIKNYEVATN